MTIHPIQPNHFVVPPTPPQDPPTARNVASAIRYEARINHRYLTNADNVIPDNVFVEAAQYRASVLAAYGHGDGEMPNWFMPALEAALEAAQAPVLMELHDMRIALLKSINSQRGNGLRNFDIVPRRTIVNGQEVLQDPTQPPHNLPALRTLDDIRGLNRHQSRDYYGFYYVGPGEQPRHEVRQEQIAFAIGAASLYR